MQLWPKGCYKEPSVHLPSKRVLCKSTPQALPQMKGRWIEVIYKLLIKKICFSNSSKRATTYV